MYLGCFTAVKSQMEKELARVVKATIESTLSHLRTIGALAIDEFVVRIKLQCVI